MSVSYIVTIILMLADLYEPGLFSHSPTFFDVFPLWYQTSHSTHLLATAPDSVTGT